MATQEEHDDWESQYEDQDLHAFQDISSNVGSEKGSDYGSDDSIANSPLKSSAKDDDNDFVIDSTPKLLPKGILKKVPSMSGGLNAPNNLSKATDGNNGFPVRRSYDPMTGQPLDDLPNLPSAGAGPRNISFITPANQGSTVPPPPDTAISRVSASSSSASSSGPTVRPSPPKSSSQVPDSQPLASGQGLDSVQQPPLGMPPPSNVITPITPPERAETTKPRGGTGTNQRGPSSPPNKPPPPPPPPPGDPSNSNPGPKFPADNNIASPGSGWDFSPLRLILESPLVWRNIPPSMIPSPLNTFSKEQVEFYLIKEYGDELYKSWLQANGDWHGVPEQPDTAEADGRPQTVGIKEMEERGGAVEPGLTTSIWAPKMVGDDVYFQSLEEKIDNQLELWESEDVEQLRPDLGPTCVFQHTVRNKNYQTTAGPKGMMIWNGVKGGVYRFPSAARMSTERKPDETSDQYFERYNDAVDGLLKYPNDSETYEGASKDRGTYRVDNQVVRREFAIDIRRIERKFRPKWQTPEMSKVKDISRPRKRRKETIFINDVLRKTEQAYIEDQRDGQLGGAGAPNDEKETIPTIDISKLYSGEMEDLPDPWIVPAEKERELRALRMDTINPNISSHSSSLKRPYLYNEFDYEYSKDIYGDAAYFVVNTDPRPLKINGIMLLYQGQIAGPLPSFAFFEAPGGQIAFWWGTMGTFYKPVPKIAQALNNVIERYGPENSSAAPAGKPGAPAPPGPPPPRRPPPPPPKKSVGQHQAPPAQQKTRTSNVTSNPPTAKERRDRQELAAATRLAEFKEKSGVQYGKTKYRKFPGVGSARSPGEVSLPNPQPAYVHIRGGEGKRKRPDESTSTRSLLKRNVVHDSEGKYYLVEVWHSYDGEPPKSRQKVLTPQEAIKLQNSGLRLEECHYPVGYAAPVRDEAPAPKKQSKSTTAEPPAGGMPATSQSPFLPNLPGQPKTTPPRQTPSRRPADRKDATKKLSANQPKTQNLEGQTNHPLTDAERNYFSDFIKSTTKGAAGKKNALPRPPIPAFDGAVDTENIPVQPSRFTNAEGKDTISDRERMRQAEFEKKKNALPRPPIRAETDAERKAARAALEKSLQAAANKKNAITRKATRSIDSEWEWQVLRQGIDVQPGNASGGIAFDGIRRGGTVVPIGTQDFFNDPIWQTDLSVGKYPRATRPDNVAAEREIASTAVVPQPKGIRRDIELQTSIYGYPEAAQSTRAVVEQFDTDESAPAAETESEHYPIYRPQPPPPSSYYSQVVPPPSKPAKIPSPPKTEPDYGVYGPSPPHPASYYERPVPPPSKPAKVPSPPKPERDQQVSGRPQRVPPGTKFVPSQSQPIKTLSPPRSKPSQASPSRPSQTLEPLKNYTTSHQPHTTESTRNSTTAACKCVRSRISKKRMT